MSDRVLEELLWGWVVLGTIIGMYCWYKAYRNFRTYRKIKRELRSRFEEAK